MKIRSLAIAAAAFIVTAVASPALATYHPGMGRFLQRDPHGTMIAPTAPRVGIAGPAAGGGFVARDPMPTRPQPGLQYADGMNLYQYVHSNPISKLDPSGLSTLSEAIDRLKKAGKPVTQQSAFDEWYRNEKTLGAWWAVLPKCPCSLKCPAVPGIHNPDPKKWNDPKKPSTAEEALHPGITWTMRSKAVGGHHNQCTYDNAGKLITVPPAAGTLDYKKPGTLSHVRHDVDPVVSANVLDGGKHVKWWWPWPNKMSKPIGANVKKYYEVTPTWSYDCPHNDI